MDRKQAVEYAKKSMELSGFVFEEEEIALLERIKNGDLPITALYDAADRRIAQLRKERPEIFVKETE